MINDQSLGSVFDTTEEAISHDFYVRMYAISAIPTEIWHKCYGLSFLKSDCEIVEYWQCREV